MIILNEDIQITNLKESRRHICYIYDTLQELQETILSFLFTSYQKDQKVIFIMEHNLLSRISDYLKQKLASQGTGGNLSQLFFINTDEIMLKSDNFDPFQTIRVLIEQVREARIEGFKSVRCIIDMNWSSCNNWALTDYETRINKYLIPQYPCTAVCLYNLKKFNPLLLRNIIAQHPQIMHKGGIINNCYYNPPSAFLSQKSGEQEIQTLLKTISVEQRMGTNNKLKLEERDASEVNRINNCYRAILAIVNCLGSVCNRKGCLTEIYQDLSEIAYYIMDKDKHSVLKGIEQITISIKELENEIRTENQEKDATVRLILDEIRTHLQYLRIQIGQDLL
ncbi:MAG TPA: MEDS domain-containing protein [Syntrophomonadaceae bacterium]|nr:MEDS domain-containing protein [Syntrophomonadaceae bacterium]